MKPPNKIMTVAGILVGLFLLLMLLLSCGRITNKTEPQVSLGKKSLEHEILTYAGIDSVLDTFEKIPYEKLDPAYLKFSGYDKEIYKEGIKGKIFYKVVGGDVFKNLVGKFRVNDFLPEDDVWLRNMNSVRSNYTQYLCIDKDVLHRFLDLIKALGKKGYDKYAFRIKDGFRYPNFNNRTGGARLSQHIYGKAIDLSIGDIDKDGKFTEAGDKKIVLSLLENDIIKNTGGVGRYPGTNAVHFDTRGYKARW
jgi:uncharacterized protein YcbK (DUF882 family)